MVPVDEWFVGRPAYQRAIFEAVEAHLSSVGPIVVDAVGVGLLIKKVRTFAELRPMKDKVRLSVLLSRPLADPRIVRTEVLSSRRTGYFVDLRGADDVDDQVRDWLTESYLDSPE